MRLGTGLLTLLVMAAAPGAVAQTAQPPTVLELFTSQGCSSCPAADKLLTAFAALPGVLALSLPVDYWDHLGWKDTLASPKHSARQKAYARALGTGNVFTPQIVVDGAAQAIGSHKAEIEKAIERLRSEARPRIGLTAASDGKRMTIEVGAANGSAPVSATIWLAVVAPRVEVEIKRGENRGRTLAYHNVVRDITPVGMWSGKPMRVELPASVVMEASARCAVLLQVDDGGRILSAAWMR